MSTTRILQFTGADLRVTKLGVSSNVEVGSANLFVDTSTGRVGVGTDSGTGQMEIYGAGQTATDSFDQAGNMGGVLAVKSSDNSVGSGGAIMFGSQNGYHAAIKASLENGNDNTRGRLGFYTRNVTTDSTMNHVMTIADEGRVGIGLTNPGTPLHVSSPNFVSDAVGPASSANTVVRFSSTESDSTLLFGLSANASYISSFSKTGFSTERQIILNANGGNVGIGTKLPTSLLDVNGVIKQVGASWSRHNLSLTEGSSGTTGNKYAYLNDQTVVHRNCTITQEAQGDPSEDTRTRVTITVPGRYFIYFNAFRHYTVASTYMEVQLYKNGQYQEIRAYNGGGNGNVNNNVGDSSYGYLTAGGQAAILDLAKDDYLELYLRVQVHGNQSVYFSGHLIGA